jgi:hypothetical protein
VLLGSGLPFLSAIAARSLSRQESFGSLWSIYEEIALEIPMEIDVVSPSKSAPSIYVCACSPAMTSSNSYYLPGQRCFVAL